MHESHWPSNLALVLPFCTCIPNLDEIEQFLEQLEHGNQRQTDRRTDGQTQINIPRFLQKAGDNNDESNDVKQEANS